MTNGNELRIGNWVRFKHLLCFIITIKQDNCEIQSSRLVVNSSYDFIEPIPLTPEILEKCGFEKGGIYFYFSKFRVVKIANSDNWLILLSNHYQHICRLQHLHQLQNLYYALTGEELNFKP